MLRHGALVATGFTNRIATAAGVSVGSLYQYFPSKDAIAVELLRRYRESLVELVTGVRGAVLFLVPALIAASAGFAAAPLVTPASVLAAAPAADWTTIDPHDLLVIDLRR